MINHDCKSITLFPGLPTICIKLHKNREERILCHHQPSKQRSFPGINSTRNHAINYTNHYVSYSYYPGGLERAPLYINSFLLLSTVSQGNTRTLSPRGLPSLQGCLPPMGTAASLVCPLLCSQEHDGSISGALSASGCPHT